MSYRMILIGHQTKCAIENIVIRSVIVNDPRMVRCNRFNLHSYLINDEQLIKDEKRKGNLPHQIT